MGQRFGSPTATAESGTEEEFRWALQSYKETGFPEIKWFFKNVEQFVAPPDPAAISAALTQWERVRAFKDELKTIPLFISEYKDVTGFKDTFENDLNRWLHDPARPWITVAPHREETPFTISIPDSYLEKIQRDFHRLDIAGIDNERAFEIPLSKIYVRLRVMFDEESEVDASKSSDGGSIDIQTALLRYKKLVIVGDPGSGKSTFLKYVALMLARAIRTNNPAIALAKLSLQEPLPLPIFVSCWDLSDFLKQLEIINLGSLLAFLGERMRVSGFPVTDDQLHQALTDGNCCLLFDGLDEVPTDGGRASVSRLLEECVETFANNRYLITSRVRAYTGDTILKGAFARADIQPFDASDRAQFLTNWVALLFGIAPDQITQEGSEPNTEFRSVTSGIEANDRIRPLAVNPLLLTVIAIVHWNRKRLPEQRIELYDECVDVLLGQRKEAERVQLTRKVGLDEQHEQGQLEERAWVRKRFGEIALHVLSGAGNRDETSRDEVVRLIVPRFIDRGAGTQELAEIRAAQFLRRQEVTSGLLVSRREQSYRFVHLTFQEYLAAWYLANRDFDEVIAVIEPHLRQQRWFETLQLLGSEWAKQSDEKLDRYVGWLLTQQGGNIAERAPVIALCANIVKDVVGVAELKPITREAFRQAVEGTLDAFRPASGIPAFTQLEILEALGQLGATVKSHLITATRSGLFQVRRRAIEMLLPHLGDDELFDLGHLLRDRSKEPIKTYLRAMLNRDSDRLIVWLDEQQDLPGKTTDAFTEMLLEFRTAISPEHYLHVLRRFFEKGSSYNDYFWYAHDYQPSSRAHLLVTINDETLILEALRSDRETGVRIHALATLVAKRPLAEETWQIVSERALDDDRGPVRFRAFQLLATHRNELPTTWQAIREASASGQDNLLRKFLLRLLGDRRKDDPQTWEHVRNVARDDGDSLVRREALDMITERWPDDPDTWRFVYTLVFDEKNPRNRRSILSLLWRRLSHNPQIRDLLAIAVKSDESSEIRCWALWCIGLETFEATSSKKLLSRDLDGREPSLDPADPIDRDRISAAALKLHRSEAEIRGEYQDIANKLEQQWSVSLRLSQA